MLERFKLSFLGALLVAGLSGGAVFATIPTSTVSAVGCDTTFLTLPAWYRGVSETKGNKCEIKSPPRVEGNTTEQKNLQTAELQKYIWKIVLNVIEIIFQLIGYAAVAFMIYGGFLYMISDGSPEKRAQGTKTLINAAVGIMIAIGAVAAQRLLWGLFADGSVNAYGVYVVNEGSVVRGIFNTVYFIAGAIAVIVIILSGINYITANGEPARITKAKRSLLYGVIGLCIVIVASPLTLFIIERL